MKKTIIWVVAILVIIGGVAWYNYSKNKVVTTTETVKIGSILPLTGDFAFFGGEIIKGAQIAVDEAKKEGLNVEFISEDDHSTATGAVNAANKLVRIDKAEAILTATLQEVKPMTGIFSDGTVPLLATWDSNDYIKSAGKNIFTIGFSTEDAGEQMANYAFNKLNLRNVAVVNAQDEWSSIIADAFVIQFKKLGGKIVLKEEVGPSQKEFRTQIAKIKSLKADGVYAPLLPTTIGPMLKQMKELNVSATFMTADSFTTDEIATSGGGAEGVYFSNLYLNNSKTLDEKYLAKYKEPSGASVFVSFGYDGVKTVLAAIKIAKSKDIPVSDAMRQVNIAGTDAPINMKGGQYSEKYERLYQVKGTDFIEIKN